MGIANGHDMIFDHIGPGAPCSRGAHTAGNQQRESVRWQSHHWWHGSDQRELFSPDFNQSRAATPKLDAPGDESVQRRWHVCIYQRHQSGIAAALLSVATSMTSPELGTATAPEVWQNRVLQPNCPLLENIRLIALAPSARGCIAAPSRSIAFRQCSRWRQRHRSKRNSHRQRGWHGNHGQWHRRHPHQQNQCGG